MDPNPISCSKPAPLITETNEINQEYPKQISWSEFIPPNSEIVELDHDYSFDSCGTLIKAKCYNGIHREQLKFLRPQHNAKYPEDAHFYFSLLQKHVHLNLACNQNSSSKLVLNDITAITLTDKTITLTNFTNVAGEFSEKIPFKFGPLPSHILQTIADNLVALLIKAKIIYPKYSNHTIKLKLHHPSDGYKLLLI